jgi:Vitamin K-dependent gamma-carboxylase
LDADLRPQAVTATAWKAFWFEEVDSRIYALLRMLFGTAGCLSLVGLGNLGLLWSCDGLVPLRNHPMCAALIANKLSWLPAIVLAGAAVSYVALALGYLSRLATLSAFVSIFLMSWWNPLPMSGAHQVLRTLLFPLLFVDTGRVWSLDAWRRAGSVSPVPNAGSPIWPLRLIQIQVCLIYLVTGLWKLMNAAWRDGSAMHYVLQNNQFTRFAVPALGISTTLLTYSVVAWEIGFAFLVLHHVTRKWVLAIGVLMHLGMWLVLELGPFSWIMLASYVAFLDRDWMTQKLQKLQTHWPARALSNT